MERKHEWLCCIYILLYTRHDCVVGSDILRVICVG
jgi:hypothetical protein